MGHAPARGLGVVGWFQGAGDLHLDPLVFGQGLEFHESKVDQLAGGRRSSKRSSLSELPKSETEEALSAT